MADDSRLNNFDLIRLVAASSVAIDHTTRHLDLSFGTFGEVAQTFYTLFPGVPVFFVVSGYLVSASFHRSPSLSAYARKRALRIFPALWLVFFGSLATVVAFGFVTREVALSPAFFAWCAGQLTVMQIYNPDFLRGFGVGVLNGSLWTVPVEIGFYVALPMIFGLATRARLAGTKLDSCLVGLVLASWALGRWVLTHPDLESSYLLKLIRYSPLSHLWVFLLGVLLQRHSGWVERVVAGRALPWVACYVALFQVGREADWIGSAWFELLARVLLAHCVLALAFTGRNLSHRLLRENDISYGIYLVHMPIVNTLLHQGWSNERWLLAVALGASAVLATLSWKLVEQPALALKPTRRSWPRRP
ncbi:MAG: acyltransferase [Pseudomonadales bacterium]|jgi:peptidoglycan/LPS O-acetylase OafA/YrhL|nr:acyltransferase [Pseudomonadales bacterium]